MPCYFVHMSQEAGCQDPVALHIAFLELALECEFLGFMSQVTTHHSAIVFL